MPCLDLEHATPDRKGIISSRCVGPLVTYRREMEEAVATYMARAAEKMRRQRLATAHVAVFINTTRTDPVIASTTASRPCACPWCNAPAKLTEAALRALKAIYRPAHRYRKAGVMLFDLHLAATAQGGLFDAPDSPRSAALMRAIDALNRDFGRGTVSYAAAGRTQGWKLRSDFHSTRYTTSWQELLRV